MQRMTRQRAAVGELLADTDDFRSAQQLHEMLREAGHSVGLATVYRTMQTLAENGDVDVLRNAEGESLYRRCRKQVHHHHLVCRDCGRTVELDAAIVEHWAAEVGQAHGFVDVEHTAELFGTCAQCARRGSHDA
ncbi:transcriptional repressor [Occultella glacieicola]|uniref:Transcriptional repressor n=1 Tax=Occultella glacieicola TaxID=2518684 RepID=A0ABY2DZ57_9MICO|nr:Fur family transcriptional regulator [Occultella glacieicola]TDE89974.1 transcriptional repressor [Occultella glacieicola]